MKPGDAPTPEPVPPDEALLTDAAGVGKLLQVSVRHVQKLDASGRLLAGISLGRAKRWRVDEVRRWVAAGCPARAVWMALQQGPALRPPGGGR